MVRNTGEMKSKPLCKKKSENAILGTMTTPEFIEGTPKKTKLTLYGVTIQIMEEHM
uniref:Uncharacterized protein n=1 Tax=Arion vulgaris TaxID=1028688 RepID=A0A0B7B9Y9_9EUPU